MPKLGDGVQRDSVAANDGRFLQTGILLNVETPDGFHAFGKTVWIFRPGLKQGT